MTGSLLLGLWLVAGAAEPLEVVSTPPRQTSVEAGAGLALMMWGWPSLLVVGGAEFPSFTSEQFFVGFTLKGDWRHYAPVDTSSLDRVNLLAGLRLGVRLGRVFEFFLGFGAGAAGQWQGNRWVFRGWQISDQFGVGFQAGVGARLRLGDRLSLFLSPAEVTGAFWPLGLTMGMPLTADFTASAGLRFFL